MTLGSSGSAISEPISAAIASIAAIGAHQFPACPTSYSFHQVIPAAPSPLRYPLQTDSERNKQKSSMQVFFMPNLQLLPSKQCVCCRSTLSDRPRSYSETMPSLRFGVSDIAKVLRKCTQVVGLIDQRGPRPGGRPIRKLNVETISNLQTESSSLLIRPTHRPCAPRHALRARHQPMQTGGGRIDFNSQSDTLRQ